MPQFETTYFISQIVWMFFSFGCLYLGVYFVIFPLFNATFKARQERIDGVLENAEKLTKATQEKEEKIEYQKQRIEQKSADRLSMFQQQQIRAFQKEVLKTENFLLKALQKKIQSAEGEEKKVLAHADDFVLKAMKGKA